MRIFGRLSWSRLASIALGVGGTSAILGGVTTYFLFRTDNGRSFRPAKELESELELEKKDLEAKEKEREEKQSQLDQLLTANSTAKRVQSCLNKKMSEYKSKDPKLEECV